MSTTISSRLMSIFMNSERKHLAALYDHEAAERRALDHTALPQRIDFCLAHLQKFAEDILIMLGEHRRAALHGCRRTRQPHRVPFIGECAADFGVLDDGKHLAMLQLRIVFHTIFRILHDGGDNSGGLTFPHDVVASPRARPVADDLIELILI